MLFEITPNLIINTRYIVALNREQFGTYYFNMEGDKIIIVYRPDVSFDNTIEQDERTKNIEVRLDHPSHLQFENNFKLAMKSQEE